MNQKTAARQSHAHSCLSCGEDWHHIGEDRPDPECPVCGSPAVTPIGRLKYEGMEEVELDDDIDVEFKRATATDQTGREFRFLFALESDPYQATLERVVVKVGEAFIAVDLDRHRLSPRTVGLPDIRPQVRLVVGRRPVRVTGQEELK